MAMVFKKLLRNPVSLLGLVLLLGFVLVAIFAPVIAPTPERYKDDPYRIPRYRMESSPVASVAGASVGVDAPTT